MPAQLTKELLELRKKYLNNTATSAEIQLLEQYYELFADEANATEQMSASEIASMEEYLEAGIAQQIMANDKAVTPFYKRTLVRAAAILVFISTGIFFLYNKHNGQQIANNKPVTHDVAPGGNKAILTLANGAKVVLNSVKNGNL